MTYSIAELKIEYDSISIYEALPEIKNAIEKLKGETAENAVEHPENPHILLCSGNAAQSLSTLYAAKANIRILRETTALS